MKKRVLAMLLILTLCFCGMGTTAQTAAVGVYVVSNMLPVYQYPSFSSRCLGTMAYGEVLCCLAVWNGWAMVKNSSGAVGYCAQAGLSVSNPNCLNVNVYINTANTNVYRYPNLYSKVMMKLGLNSCYRAVAVTRDGNWVRLQNGNHFGFVPINCISNKPVTVTSALTKADLVAMLAAYQLGKGYAYGAEGSSKFDCSGLVWYVYKHAAGITLPRTSDQQAADGRFQKIGSLSSVKKGDLLCFSTEGGGIDHVGIYIGGGKFIHASQSKGQVVVSELNTSYYKSSFRWARRIV